MNNQNFINIETELTKDENRVHVINSLCHGLLTSVDYLDDNISLLDNQHKDIIAEVITALQKLLNDSFALSLDTK